MDETADEPRHPFLRAALDFVPVIILSVTTLFTAWAAFEATKWGGEQAMNMAAASATRNESIRSDNIARSQMLADVTTFVAWAEAVATENEQLSTFYFDRFRGEFRPAVEAWLETKPLQNQDAPATPFEMDAYHLEALAQSRQYLADSEAFAAEARRSNQRADNYVATTILFAAVLFFVGISTRARTPATKTTLVSMAAIGLCAGIVLLALMPIEL